MRTIKSLIPSLSLLLVLGSVAKAQQTVDDTRLFDSTGDTNWESIMARLDNYAVQLQKEPNANGVLIVYGGQNMRRGEPKAWARCIRDYLLNRRGLQAQKVTVINGGYRESFVVEMWETLRKGYLVTPSPTVKARDVRFSKGRIRRWRKLCSL